MYHSMGKIKKLVEKKFSWWCTRKRFCKYDKELTVKKKIGFDLHG